MERGKFIFAEPLSEIIVKNEQKEKNRHSSSIRNIVKIAVRGGEITIRPAEDPLKSIEKLVVKGTMDVEGDIRRLRRAAERELQKEA